MLNQIHEKIDPILIEKWQSQKYVSLDKLKSIAVEAGEDHAAFLLRLNHAFHSSLASRESLSRSASAGNAEAREMLEMLQSTGGQACDCCILEDSLFHDLSTEYWADEKAYLNGSREWYPKEHDGKKIGFRMDWIRRILAKSCENFSDFSSGRGSDTAVLIGNGPSLRHEDLSLLNGHDVFISNYAVKHPWLASIARGIAVSNAWVSAQEPYWFQLAACWKFFPFWHGESVCPDDGSIFLNAHGGDLFFSTDVTKSISWHSTVTHFWLQILYSAGYRKVILIGIDNFYHQPVELQEGDLIDQQADDPNHFDPSYFRGRKWQAADTSKMQAAYAMVKEHYERDGREIVNCTTGGNLELFRRSSLSRELCRPLSQISRGPSSSVAPPTVFASHEGRPHWDLCRISEKKSAELLPCGDKTASLAANDFLFQVDGRLASRELVAIAAFRAPVGTAIEIRLGSACGEAVDLACVSTLSAGPGLQWIAVRHVFSKNHGTLCVRVGCPNSRNAHAEPIVAEHVFVMESPGSIFNHLKSNSGLLAEANRLMLENQIMSCVPLYLYLDMIRPLGIYMTDARLSLGMLGISQQADQDAIFRELGHIAHPG